MGGSSGSEAGQSVSAHDAGSATQSAAPNRIAVLARRLLPPLAAFVLARARLAHSASAAGADAFSAHAWSRWDSAHYLSIAKHGYELFSCARLPGYDPTLWCGNAAWLSGFPLLVRTLHGMGLSLEFAGALIAGGFALATLVVLWNGLLDAELSLAAGLTLLLAAFVPGHVYHHAVFPVSMASFFSVLALYAYRQRRLGWAGLAGACGAFTYSSGVFLAAVFGLHLLCTDHDRPWRVQVRQWLLTAGITVCGFIAFLLLLQFETGTWRAYFLVQAKYAYSPSFPLLVIAKHAFDARLTGGRIVDAQTVYVAALAISLCAAAMRRPRVAFDGALVIFLMVYWWVPLALGGALSIYRAEAVLLPAVVLARKLPVPVLLVLLAIAVVLAAKMDVLFFKGVLV